MLSIFLCPESEAGVSGCRVDTALIIMHEVCGSLLKVMAIHYREPDQGEGHSHAKAILSYIIPCFLRACKFLVVTSSDMTTEFRVISIVLSLNKVVNNSRGFFYLVCSARLKI